MASTPGSATRRNTGRTNRNSSISDSQQLQLLLDIEQCGGIANVDLKTLAKNKPDVYGEPRSKTRRAYEHRLHFLKSFSPQEYFDYFRDKTRKEPNSPPNTPSSAAKKTPSSAAKTPSSTAKKTPAKTPTAKKTPVETEKTPTPQQTSKPKTPTPAKPSFTPAKPSFTLKKSVNLPANAFTMSSRSKKNTKNDDSDEDEVVGTYASLSFILF